MWNNTVVVASLSFVLLSVQVRGQEETPPKSDGEVVGEAIEASLGFALTSKYFFRGILQEKRDLILQPSLDLVAHLHESEDDWVKSVDLNLGTWNSLHTGASGTGGPNSSPRLWYESDFYAGLGLGFGSGFGLGVTYTAYTSPNGVFGSVHELMFSLSYDDSDLWGEGFGGLQPHLGVAFEMQGQADGGAKRGSYLELGIEPSFEILKDDEYPISLSVPVNVGLSLSDYYEGVGGDETFGYLDVGLDVTIPMAFMGSRYGSWEMSAGVHFLVLGDSTRMINGGDDFEVIGTLGFSCSF